jgi:hypothetical protein
MSESNANRDLADTARMRGLDALRDDPLEDTQRLGVTMRRSRSHEAECMNKGWEPRERRKLSTVGARAPETMTARDVVSERDQSAIESGVWPRYEP